MVVPGCQLDFMISESFSKHNNFMIPSPPDTDSCIGQKCTLASSCYPDHLALWGWEQKFHSSPLERSKLPRFYQTFFGSQERELLRGQSAPVKSSVSSSTAILCLAFPVKQIAAVMGDNVIILVTYFLAVVKPERNGRRELDNKCK